MLDGRRSEATETIETWLTAQPQNADAYVEDAWRWQQDGDLLKAQGRLQQALKLDPHNVRALTQMGILYELLERPDRALALYEEALIEDPTRNDLKERIQLLQARGVKAPLPD
jgi:tetratricopeptide (TPR) repeat protein